MKYILFVVLLVLSKISFSQSLSAERIAKIKNCTVKIAIENQVSGTGFFIDSSGQILTCWHVIEPALNRSPLNNGIDSIKNLYLILNSGEKVQIGISTQFLFSHYKEAVAYDFCLLQQIVPRKFAFLKIGDFNKVNEGQEVYTCGFPFGRAEPFVSKGIISTIYVDSTNAFHDKGKTTPMPRKQALLDLTSNKGNSGGPIIKLTKSLATDEVIGIADFIINPVGNSADSLMKYFSKKIANVTDSVAKENIKNGVIDPNSLFLYFTQVLSSTSNGVSGCISTNHFLTTVKTIRN